jgi:hypothetical protein
LLDRPSSHNALEILKRDIHCARLHFRVAERDTPLGR